jgi:hypothetical protein
VPTNCTVTLSVNRSISPDDVISPRATRVLPRRSSRSDTIASAPFGTRLSTRSMIGFMRSSGSC